MDGFDDLERRLVARLRPARVPGAEETWRRIAPLLEGRAGPATRRTGLAWATGVAAAIVLLATLLLVRLPVGRQPAAGATAVTAVPQVVALSSDPTALRAACGPWDTTASPQSRFDMADCVARVAAGWGETMLAGVGVNYGRWSEAAAAFAVPLTLGPAPDRLVAVVKLERGDGGGEAVILDAETGLPYLLIQVK